MQSHVPEHAELMWLLTSVTPLGELERMTQFKDKSQRLESIPAGLLNYPILMAADILLYRADLVPVGDDQVQHLELTREYRAAVERRVRRRTARIFPEPQPLLTPARRILGLDGQAKMSKSLGNTIGLLETPEEIWQKLRPGHDRSGAQDEEAIPGTRRSATSSRCTATSPRPTRWPRWRGSAAAPSGAASTASGCWRTTWSRRSPRSGSARPRSAADAGRGARDILAAGAARARAEARRDARPR